MCQQHCLPRIAPVAQTAVANLTASVQHQHASNLTGFAHLGMHDVLQ